MVYVGESSSRQEVAMMVMVVVVVAGGEGKGEGWRGVKGTSSVTGFLLLVVAHSMDRHFASKTETGCGICPARTDENKCGNSAASRTSSSCPSVPTEHLRHPMQHVVVAVLPRAA